jgi:hypothetical protein
MCPAALRPYPAAAGCRLHSWGTSAADVRKGCAIGRAMASCEGTGGHQKAAVMSGEGRPGVTGRSYRRLI